MSKSYHSCERYPENILKYLEYEYQVNMHWQFDNLIFQKVWHDTLSWLPFPMLHFLEWPLSMLVYVPFRSVSTRAGSVCVCPRLGPLDKLSLLLLCIAWSLGFHLSYFSTSNSLNMPLHSQWKCIITLNSRGRSH